MAQASRQCLDCMGNCRGPVDDCINNQCRSLCGIPPGVDRNATWAANYIPHGPQYVPGSAGPNSGSIIAPLNTIEAFRAGAANGGDCKTNKSNVISLVILCVILLLLIYHIFVRHNQGYLIR